MKQIAWLVFISSLAAADPVQAEPSGFPFETTGEFLSQCGGVTAPEECLNAILYVEQVVDGGDNPNATCDGGPSQLLKARSNAELDAELEQRRARIAAWLRDRPEYAGQSYGDGIWSALKGVYCR
ncbi:MAG TPA: hypothetical protein VG983_00315 [Caulobacterales bacterium]|nr:hypothetical protein [Caulobacterales bacterium]